MLIVLFLYQNKNSQSDDSYRDNQGLLPIKGGGEVLPNLGTKDISPDRTLFPCSAVVLRTLSPINEFDVEGY